MLVLDEFDKDSASRLWMEKRDLMSPRAGPGSCIDEFDVQIARTFKRVFDVRCCEREVVDARAVVIEIPLNSSRFSRFKQFEVAAIDIKKANTQIVEFLLVDDVRLEQRTVLLAKRIRVVSSDPSVIEIHTDR